LTRTPNVTVTWGSGYYDDEGNEVLRSPEDFVDTLPEYPEDVSLISRAIEMVKEKLEEKK